MTSAPHAVSVRSGVKLGDATMVDTMVKDGLTDSFNDYHMGITAENVAKKWEISREDQDRFAVECQQKIGVAQKEGWFDAEITPVEVKDRRSTTTIPKTSSQNQTQHTKDSLNSARYSSRTQQV